MVILKHGTSWKAKGYGLMRWSLEHNGDPKCSTSQSNLQGPHRSHAVLQFVYDLDRDQDPVECAYLYP